MNKFSNSNNGLLPFVKEKKLTPAILGILIVIAGFAVFNIFNKFAPGTIETTEENTNEEAINTDINQQENIELTTNQDLGESIQSTSTWIANDYKSGDITTESYTVINGDTLWEISEAVYGTGYSWQKIANANDVTYLSNGNPLIIPGQVLTLPQS